MSTQKIEQLIDSTQPDLSEKGKAFVIEFTKRDGSNRVMKCRLGITRRINGKGQNYDITKHNIRTLWSIGDQGYRNVKLDTITKFNGMAI